jgi:hypothetical protein
MKLTIRKAYITVKLPVDFLAAVTLPCISLGENKITREATREAKQDGDEN